MKMIPQVFTVSLGLALCVGCDAPEDDDQDVAIDDGGKADVGVPTGRFPGTDTHCKGVFNGRCDLTVAFGPNQWGSVGAPLSGSARPSGEVLVRAFIESADLSRVRTRLHYAPEPVQRIDQAEQIAVLEASGTRTGFGGDGMEVRVSAQIQSFMVDGGRLDGVFYLAFSGAAGTIRAIDADLR